MWGCKLAATVARRLWSTITSTSPRECVPGGRPIAHMASVTSTHLHHAHHTHVQTCPPHTHTHVRERAPAAHTTPITARTAPAQQPHAHRTARMPRTQHTAHSTPHTAHTTACRVKQTGKQYRILCCVRREDGAAGPACSSSHTQRGLSCIAHRTSHIATFQHIAHRASQQIDQRVRARVER